MTALQFMATAFCVLMGVVFLLLAALVVTAVVIGIRRAFKNEGNGHE